MDSKRSTVTSSQVTQPKNILFSCLVWPDGLGDLGHLISVVNPEILQSMPVKSYIETPHSLGSLYFIICKYKHIKFVIENLVSANILSKEELSFVQELAEFEKDEANDFIDAYVKELSEKNPNVFIHVVTVDKFPQKLLRERVDEEDEYSALEEEMIDELAGTNFYNQMKNSILQVNISTPLAINIFKNLERTPIKINIAEHDSGYFTRNSIDECIMGFGNDHQGIFLEDIKPLSLEQKIERISKIENREYLLNLLSLQHLKQQDAKVIRKENFGLKKVDLDKHIKQFLQSSLFVPGYIQDKIAMATFISSLSISYAAKQFKEIVFHINKSSFMSYMLAGNLLRANGITLIEINDNGKITTIELVKNVKNHRKIRILTGFYLSNEDYDLLFKIAQYFAGCSGDKSLERTLAAGLIPLYATRRWKRIFTDQFVAAGQKYSEEKAVTAYNKAFKMLETPVVKQVDCLPEPTKIDSDVFYLIKKNISPEDKDKHIPVMWKLYEPIRDVSTDVMSLRECEDISLENFDACNDATLRRIRRQVRAYRYQQKIPEDAAFIAAQCSTPQFYLEYQKIIKGFRKDYNFFDILPAVILQGIVFYQLQRAVNEDNLGKFNLQRTLDILDVIADPNGLTDMLRIALMIDDIKLAVVLLKIFMGNVNNSDTIKIVTPSESFMLTIKNKQGFYEGFFNVINIYKDKIITNESLLAIIKEFKLDSHYVHNHLCMNIHIQIQQFLASSSFSSSSSSSVSHAGVFAGSADNIKKRKTEIGHGDGQHKKVYTVNKQEM